MFTLKTVLNVILLITTPTFFLYPQEHSSRQDFQIFQAKHAKKNHQKSPANHQVVTYDEIMHLLDELETGRLEKRASIDDLERINQFLILLARQGVVSYNADYLALEEDVDDLLYGEDDYYEFAISQSDEDYVIMPAILNNQHEIILCKSWIKKQWKKTKKFVKKHKKEIIIGAAVVVAAVVIVAVVAASTAGAAAVAAVGAAGASAAGANNNKEKDSSGNEPPLGIPSDPIDIASPLETTLETPVLKTAIDEHISNFKQFMGESGDMQQLSSARGWDDLSFGEKARECGAFLAHQAFEGISELARVVPDLCEEIKELGIQILPDTISNMDYNLNTVPSENYDKVISAGHKAIDAVFSSDQADCFSAEGSTNGGKNDFILGMIPLPSGVAAIFSDTNKLITAGNVFDRAGFTRAGRALMKHGYREGSFFPKPLGNPMQINKQGESILTEILNDPSRIIIKNTSGGIEIYAPNGRGAYFREDGTFRGFIEYGHK